MTVVRPYRGVSADDRRSQRRRQLTEACLEVIGRVGLAAATVGDICEQAGLTKRYFYESFADRDAILLYVFDELFTTVWEHIARSLEQTGRDSNARAQVTVQGVVDVMAGDPRLARLYVEAPGHPQLLPRRQQAFEDFANLWAKTVRGLHNPDSSEFLAAFLFISGTTEVLINWLNGTLAVERHDLVDELVALGMHYPTLH